jgi:Leucine-rich repeat (LRR) protein
LSRSNSRSTPEEVFEMIDLQKRSLETIDSSIFTDYSSSAIKTLNLSENIIRSIASNTFNGCTRLVFLDLSNNKIECLNMEILSGLGFTQNIRSSKEQNKIDSGESVQSAHSA